MPEKRKTFQSKHSELDIPLLVSMRGEFSFTQTIVTKYVRPGRVGQIVLFVALLELVSKH